MLKPLCTNPELQAPPRPWRQEIQLQGLSSCPTQNGVQLETWNSETLALLDYFEQ